MSTGTTYEEQLKPQLSAVLTSADRRAVFEKRIVHWCAPTLVGIKPSNLFTFVFRDGTACRSCPDAACRELKRRDFSSALHECRPQLRDAGLGIVALTVRPSGALVLVYRRDLLSERLRAPRTAAFLMECGYNPFDTERCLWELARRIRRADRQPDAQRRNAFPHEVGFMLGYPYEEVVAFMEGRPNGTPTGAWKAYGNPAEARACARNYRRCRLLCEELYRRGTGLTELAGMGWNALEGALRAG